MISPAARPSSGASRLLRDEVKIKLGDAEKWISKRRRQKIPHFLARRDVPENL